MWLMKILRKHYLFKNKIIDVCYSGDSDTYVYGCNIVLQDLDHNNNYQEFINCEILKNLKLSNIEFINLCVALKNDYNFEKTDDYLSPIVKNKSEII